MKLLENRFALIFALATALYWAFAPYFGGPVMIEITNGLAFGAFVGFIISWSKTVWVSLKRGGNEGADQLKVGLFFAFLTLGVFHRAWASIVRWGEYDPALTSHPILGYILLLAAISGWLCIAAPGAVEGAIPSHNRNWIIAAVAIGMAFAGFMFGTAWSRVDFTPRGIIISDGSTRPQCPSEMPVKVSDRGVIHPPNSIWYGITTPAHCFKTPEDAKKAGFRLPRLSMLR